MAARPEKESVYIQKKETTRGREEEAATVTTAKGVDGKEATPTRPLINST